MKLISSLIGVVSTKEHAAARLRILSKALKGWMLISLIAILFAFILIITKNISVTAFCLVILCAIHGPIITCSILSRGCYALMPAREISREIASQFAKR